MFKEAPISSSYMLVSMIGFILSAILIDVMPTWAFAFLVVFAVMFASSVMSLGNIPIDDHHALEELKVHDPLHFHKKREAVKRFNKK